MAGHNDLGVLGNLAAHVLHERLVGDHVASAQPPAAQAVIGQLLEDIEGAPLRLGNVDGHLDRSIHCCLQRMSLGSHGGMPALEFDSSGIAVCGRLYSRRI